MGGGIVQQVSKNSVNYLLTKYMKYGHWRVVVCPTYTWDVQ
jgi:hypothetical protein